MHSPLSARAKVIPNFLRISMVLLKKWCWDAIAGECPLKS